MGRSIVELATRRWLNTAAAAIASPEPLNVEDSSAHFIVVQRFLLTWGLPNCQVDLRAGRLSWDFVLLDLASFCILDKNTESIPSG